MFACFRPEVFIVDEALSVGDVFFQQKCTTRLRELLDQGMTMIFVSHDQSAVLNLCDRALLLQRGAPTFYGSPAEAVSRYNSALSSDPAKRWARPAAPAAVAGAGAAPAASDEARIILERDVIGPARERRHGTGTLEILAARVVDGAGRDTRQAVMGEALTFQILVRAREDVPSPRVGIRFHDRFNNLVFGAGTFQQGSSLPPLAAGERLVVRFEVTMDVHPGEYTFGLGTGEPDPEHPSRGIAHDRIDLLGPITIAHPCNAVRPFYGVARLPMKVSHAAASPAPEPAS
jgi:hypothetical protein